MRSGSSPAHVRRRDRRDARAGHRRQHGDLLHHRRPPAPDVAGRRSRATRAAVAAPPSEQRSWTYPIWEEIQRHAARFDGAFAWTGFDAEFDLSGGESRFVDGVWASAGASTCSASGRRSAACSSHPTMPAAAAAAAGRDQPRVLADAFRRRARRDRPHADARARAADDRGRDAAWIFRVAPGRSFDVVVPLGAEPLIRGSESRLDRRTSWWLQVFVRLKHGQSIEAATALMQTLQPGIREATLPPSSPGGTWTGICPTRSRSSDAARGPSGLRDDYSRPLLVLMAVAGWCC